MPVDLIRPVELGWELPQGMQSQEPRGMVGPSGQGPCQPGATIPPRWDKQGTPRGGSQLQPRVQIRQVDGSEAGLRPSREVRLLVRVTLMCDESNQGQTQPSGCWAGSKSGWKVLLWVGVWINRVCGQMWARLWLSWRLQLLWHCSLGRVWRPPAELKWGSWWGDAPGEAGQGH